MKDFDKWNEEKKKTHVTKIRGVVHEREIWWCKLGANIGYEQDGKHNKFERPVLILRKFGKDTVVILPLTTKVKRNRFHFIFEHDEVEFAVILSQVRLISTRRLTRRIRKIGKELFLEIKDALGGLLFNKTNDPPR